MRSHWTELAAVLLAGGILAVLLAFDSGAPAGGGARPAADRKPMIGIAAADLNGSPWRLSDHRGKVVLVNVWASWCPPCRAETPALVQLYNAYRGRGLEIVGVSADDTVEPVRKFVADYGVPYPIVLPGAESPLVSAVDSLPTSFLIDRRGRVANVHVGAISRAELVNDIEALLAEP